MNFDKKLNCYCGCRGVCPRTNARIEFLCFGFVNVVQKIRWNSFFSSLHIILQLMVANW